MSAGMTREIERLTEGQEELAYTSLEDAVVLMVSVRVVQLL